MYSFLWLCRVFTAACGIFTVAWALEHRLSSCGAWALSPLGMRSLSSSVRDQIQVSCVKRQILNHWTTREVPKIFSLGVCGGEITVGRKKSLYKVHKARKYMETYRVCLVILNSLNQGFCRLISV